VETKIKLSALLFTPTIGIIRVVKSKKEGWRDIEHSKEKCHTHV